MEKEEFKKILEDYFNQGVDKKKFINTDRIPLICQDISNIHSDIRDIKDNQTWLVRLIIGAIVLALLGLVLVN